VVNPGFEIRYLLVVLSILVCPDARLAAGAAEPVVCLETDTIRIGFDPMRNGAIVSVVDKASGREFAAPKRAPLLYELRLAGQAPQPVVLSEAEAAGATVKKEGQSVVVTVPRHGELSQVKSVRPPRRMSRRRGDS